LIKVEDYPELIELQARVWQDYFLAERNLNVPLIGRTEQNISYYLEKEPRGCFIAEIEGQVVGVIFSHIWGKLGWFGPVEVSTEKQGKGIGKILIEHSVRYLESKGCTTIGLETMASSVKNIAIYETLGFNTHEISHVFFKKLCKKPHETDNDIRHSTSNDLPGYRELWQRLLPGLDYSVEFKSVKTMNLGETWVLETEDDLAHAIVHTYGMFENSRNAIIKLIVAESNKAASELLTKCEDSAIESGATGIFVRTYRGTPPDRGFFEARGYLLQSNSIRMILKGEDESGDNVHVSCWSG
jgi:ribosomal protein S18 acetylase RimI-like enzyme